MVLRRGSSGRAPEAAPMVAHAPPKRVFSFKDAVTSTPSKSNHSEKTPRHIRSRSITKIVESSSFKKRCEALKSHHGRKHHDVGEHVSPVSSPKAKSETKKLTPLEEFVVSTT
ncbi:Poly(A) polymerase [Phytophthora palmivora]|uniref:Poly(A) polymerase n=1 Tax=Phytophthora palmivora TaxID=4796 RepID=A0A2P4XII2_9STRA|nr:Poly(A) polymerase [Phytophthora palmivora]